MSVRNRYRWPRIALLAVLFYTAMRWVSVPGTENREVPPAAPPPPPVGARALTPPLAPAAQSPEDQSATGADPFVVPKGTPEELLQYIKRLEQQRPSSDSKDVTAKFRKNMAGTALLTASERVLDAQPKPEQAKAAVQYKIVALELLERFGDAEAIKKLESLPAELEKAGLKELVREVRRRLLQGRVLGAPSVKNEEIEKLLADVGAFLGEATPDEADANLAIQAAMAAEYHGDKTHAIQAYNDFSRRLAKSENKTIAVRAAKMEGAARRLALVGNSLSIEGKTLDGKPFDWSKYRGKVVLVDFFATWCPPCREEMPNLAKYYQAYQDKKFEVVAISLDEDREAIEKFLTENKYPWTVLLDNPELSGHEKTMANYYGVFGIPESILVGKDGKVISVSIRGPALGKELEKLLGPRVK